MADATGAARTRWRLIAAVLAVLAVVIVGWVWLRKPHPPDAPARPQAAAAASQIVATPPVPPAGDPQRADLPEAVQRYLEASVYPPDTGVLAAGAIDLLEPNRRYEQLKPVPGTHGVEPPLRFLWTADRYQYTSDQTVEARFEAEQGDAPAAIQDIEAWAQPEGRGGVEGAAIPLRLRASGDARVGSLDLSRFLPEHHGPVLLTVRYTLAGELPQEEGIRIFVTPVDSIPARFTGDFRDRLEEGSLEIEVGIEVDVPGFYRIDANLHGPSGEPVAWAAHKGELAERDGAVRLVFFGRTLVDSGIPGPYTLGELRGYLFRDGEFPDRIHLRPYPETFETRSWQLSSFSDAEWDGAHRRQMLELLLEDHRAGRSLDLPPAVSEGGPVPQAPGPPAAGPPAP